MKILRILILMLMLMISSCITLKNFRAVPYINRYPFTLNDKLEE